MQTLQEWENAVLSDSGIDPDSYRQKKKQERERQSQKKKRTSQKFKQSKAR